jgi:hypothetical protein
MCVHPLIAFSAAVASRKTKSLRFQFLNREPSFVPHPTSTAVAHALASSSVDDIPHKRGLVLTNHLPILG